MADRFEILRDELVTIVEAAGDSPPLMAAALAVSRALQGGELWPGTEETLAELENAALERATAASQSDPVDAVQGVIDLLVEEGFAGDVDTYEDPANSFLDRVLQRRRGLPISLSVLGIHLAQCTGLDLRGIGFPGHFIVGTGLDSKMPTVFDLFNGGRRLSFSDLAALYRAGTGRRIMSNAPLLRDSLQPASTRSILLRILRNLQHHYARRGAHDRVAEVVGLLSVLHPDATKLRDLEGRLNRRLETLN